MKSLGANRVFANKSLYEKSEDDSCASQFEVRALIWTSALSLMMKELEHTPNLDCAGRHKYGHTLWRRPCKFVRDIPNSLLGNKFRKLCNSVVPAGKILVIVVLVYQELNTSSVCRNRVAIRFE